MIDALALYDVLAGVAPHLAIVHCNRAIVLQLLQRFDDALRSYDRAIALQPNLTEAHSNRSVLLLSLKRPQEALQSSDRAISLAPGDARGFNNKANALMALNRQREAVENYDQAVTLDPHFAEAHCNRADAWHELGRPQEALRDYDRAIALRADYAEAHYNRASVLQELARLTEALEGYGRVIELRPNFAEAHNNRGNVLHALKRYEAALCAYERAIALDPNSVKARNNKGLALKDLERFDEALQSFDLAIQIEPQSAESHLNRGNALAGLRRFDDAIDSYDRAIALNPLYVEAYNNRGNALRKLLRIDDALQSYAQAVKIKPDHAEATCNLGICTLLAGNFEAGWPLYEWRKKQQEPERLCRYPQPAWTGREGLEGKYLFVHAEQGLGDTIQFCRYALLAQEKAAKVILAVQDPLVRLVKCLSPTIEVLQLTTPPPEFDCHIALMSMPLAFQMSLGTCPANVPYLSAEPRRVESWKRKLGHEGIKIGVCWQGNKHGEIDKGRSFPVRHFEGLSRIPGIRLISLQKGDGVEQLSDLPAGMTIETLGEEFDAGADAFIDTAAVMEGLDLVITSDTAIAHLAGALGRPAWVALPFAPDWRWLLGRSDSPWYPTLRLFRQPTPGNWCSVFAAIQAQLGIAGIDHANDGVRAALSQKLHGRLG